MLYEKYCTSINRWAAALRFSLVLVAGSFLAACGGGGGGSGGGISSSSSGPTLVSVSPTTMSFSAASPGAAVPASQIGTATVTGVTSGALYIRINIDGQVIASATNIQIISATQGQVTINPGSPATLGVGRHTSTITISACTTDPGCTGAQLAGSPKIINVTYQIGSPPRPDVVAPHIGTSSRADTVILRGQGFTSATTVKFGATAGTILSIPSDTEIQASYPALVAGSYAVTLNNGAIPFFATLNIVDAPAYASTVLSYPSSPQQIRGFAYDAERHTLLVGAGFPTSSTNSIWRYSFSGGVWSTTPSVVTFADLRDFALSLSGTQLLAIADRSMSQLDPVTLSSLSTTPKPASSFDPGEYLKQLAVANDGNVAVTTGFNSGSGSTILYFYSIAQSIFSKPTFMGGSPNRLLSYATTGASGNGSTLAMVEANLSPGQSIARYAASNGTLTSTNQLLRYITQDRNQNINGPVFDRTGSRMAVAAFTNNYVFPVYDENLIMLGLLPPTTAAFVISPDGTRAYTVEMNPNCRVRAFDLVSTFGGTIPLTEIISADYPTSAVLCPTNGVPVTDIRMLVSPDGGTLFMAGNVQVVIVPLP